MKAPHERFMEIIKKLPRETAQNRLLRLADREIALSMMYLPEADRALIFSMLSRKKSDRIREELTLHERLRVTYKQYRATIDQVIDKMLRSGPKNNFRSYLRPYR